MSAEVIHLTKNDKGVIAELAIMKNLMEQEFQSSVPINDLPFDIIATNYDYSKKILIQIKHGKYKNGNVILDTRKPNSYKKNEVDVFALYVKTKGGRELCLYIPFSEMPVCMSKNIRIKPPKNGYNKINWYEKYLKLRA